MADQEKLRIVRNVITTHNADGKAIFSKALPEETQMEPLSTNQAWALGYVTKGFPVDMSDEQDIETLKPFLASPPGVSVSGGSVVRHVDFRPGVTTAMHRTVSLDYGVVIEGRIVCMLDSGEERVLGKGDVIIQRGTMHAWKNPDPNEWTRMLFVVLPSKQLPVGGEDLGASEGVKKSE